MLNKKRVALVIFIIIAIISVKLSPNFLKLFTTPTDRFVLSKSKLLNEENAKGLIIREEQVLTDGKKNVEKEKEEGQRVKAFQNIGRYFSNEENQVVEKIAKLDNDIKNALLENQENIKSTENVLLDSKIETLLSEVSQSKNQNKIEELTKEINNVILEKAKASGELFKEGTKAKTLMDEKEKLEKSLNANTTTITTPVSGYVSYKIDGYESKLKSSELEKITKNDMDKVDINSGNVIESSKTNVKVVSNFKMNIMTVLSSKEAKESKVGNRVKLGIQGYEEIDAKIVYKKILNDKEIIVTFEVDRLIDELLKYRKIDLRVIWWTKEGLKMDNNSIVDIDGNKYIQKDKGGFTEIVPINVTEKTEEYSLIEPLSRKDFKEREILNLDIIPTVQEYDEIIANPKITKEDVKKFVEKSDNNQK